MSSHADHAEIFRRGPKAWNAWREQNPTIVPELAGIALKLSERQMGPANGGPINLKAARLHDAFLRFATLSGGNLEAVDMSGADLVHARFDGADLSAANLSNAILDHADFSGANLRNVNFSGASLRHAKNLTKAQLEESEGSDSTILPPDLVGSVAWSSRNQTETHASLELPKLEPEIRQQTVDIRETRSYQKPVWTAGILLLGGILIVTGFVWWQATEATPPTSNAQYETTPVLNEPKPNFQAERSLQPSPHQADMDTEHPPASAATEPASKALDGTEVSQEQRSILGKDDGASVTQEPSDKESDAASSSADTFAPTQQALTPPAEDHGAQSSQAAEALPPVSAEPTVVAAPEPPAETPEPSVTGSVNSVVVRNRHAIVPASNALPVDSEAPVIKSDHGTVSGLAPDTNTSDTPSTSAAVAPPQSLGLSTSPAPALSVAAIPSPSTSTISLPAHQDEPVQSLELSAPAAPSSSVAVIPTPSTSSVPLPEDEGVKTVLPHEAASIPMPVRKPVTKTSTSNSGKDITATTGTGSGARPHGSRLAKGLSLARSRSKVCVPVIGRYYEGKCSYQ